MFRVALALVLCALLAPALAAQDAGAPPVCEIRGHLSISDLHVIRPPGVMTVRSFEDRDVRVTPLGGGRFRVRTHGEGARIDGSTDQPVPIVLGAEHTFLGVATVAAGTAVDAIERVGDAFRGALVIHEGVTIQRAPITCIDLRAQPPTDGALESRPIARGPIWRARVWRFRLRAIAEDDSPPLLLELTPEARAAISWTENRRVAGWVEVRARLAHAFLDGWARDTDLTLP